jgi:hypothetical protein
VRPKSGEHALSLVRQMHPRRRTRAISGASKSRHSVCPLPLSGEIPNSVSRKCKSSPSLTTDARGRERRSPITPRLFRYVKLKPEAQAIASLCDASGLVNAGSGSYLRIVGTGAAQSIFLTYCKFNRKLRKRWACQLGRNYNLLRHVRDVTISTKFLRAASHFGCPKSGPAL